MRTQEQAFRDYYASMTDSDLLAIAKNRASFVPIAQAQVAEELRKRQLMVPADAPAETTRAPTLFTKLWRLMRARTTGTIGNKDPPRCAESEKQRSARQELNLADHVLLFAASRKSRDRSPGPLPIRIARFRQLTESGYRPVDIAEAPFD